MANIEISNRSVFEEHIRQWIDGGKPISEFECSTTTTETNEGVRATDSALKSLLWDLLDVHSEHKSSVVDSQLSNRMERSMTEATALSRFVDVMVYLCEKEMASPNLPAAIFTDMFDSMTISRCERLFHLVEDRVELWKRPSFFTPCKNQLLRMCNDLLRRLSKGQNTVFCGQILIVLAKLFPLSERSGLNIVSEFNSEYLSIRDEKQSTDEESIQEEDRATDGDNSATIVTSGAKLRCGLYRRFWNLQEFFRQPNLCYSPNHWKQMIKCSQEVLTVFSSFRLDDQAAPSRPTGTYFAKFLTSKKLFELELSDSNFRRCILIQFLIMFNYLKATVRFKLESQVLSEDQAQWVREKSIEIYKLLEQTPPNGKEFSRSIAALMSREEMWNAWKNENCPAFKVADGPERKLVRRKRPIGDDIREHLAKGQISMGSAELTRLFNICPDNWEACRGERRNYVPSMEEFFEEAIAQADPAACIEDQYKLTSNPNWGWRALRILSQKSLHFFTSTNQPAKSLPNYLDTMVGYLAKDLSVTKEGNKDNSNGTATNVKVEEVDENSQDDFKDEDGDNSAHGMNTNSTNRRITTAAASVAEDDELAEDNDKEGQKDEPQSKRTRLAAASEVSSSTTKSNENTTLSADVIERLAIALGDDCVRLLPHLGLGDEELQYVQSQHENDSVAQANHLLTLWKENEPEEATLEKAKQIAAKLGLGHKVTDAVLKC